MGWMFRNANRKSPKLSLMEKQHTVCQEHHFLFKGNGYTSKRDSLIDFYFFHPLSIGVYSSGSIVPVRGAFRDPILGWDLRTRNQTGNHKGYLYFRKKKQKQIPSVFVPLISLEKCKSDWPLFFRERLYTQNQTGNHKAYSLKENVQNKRNIHNNKINK